MNTSALPTSNFRSGRLKSSQGLLEGGWVTSSIKRVGPYSSAAVITDADLIQMIKGVAGDSNTAILENDQPDSSSRLDRREGRHRELPSWESDLASGIRMVYGQGRLRVSRRYAARPCSYNPLLLPESLYRTAVTQTPGLPTGAGPDGITAG